MPSHEGCRLPLNKRAPPGITGWPKFNGDDLPPSLRPRYRAFITVGSEEAPRGASLRPPLKRPVRFSRKPLSQRCRSEGSRKGYEWTFLSPVGLSQSASLLGRCRPGLSLKELIRVIGLTRSLAVSLRPPLPAAFPGPLGRRARDHPAFTGLEVLFGCPTTRRASLPTSSSDL